MSVNVAIVGGHGRLGTSIVRELANPDAALTCTAVVGRDTADLAPALARCDVYIDVSSPAGTLASATAALPYARAAVIGTTGLDEAAMAAIDRLATRTPVLVAANFSLGVALLHELVARAAAALAQWDAEIVESHHRFKRDAPSGTALALAETISKARTGSAGSSATLVPHRQGANAARRTGDIGIAAVRGGDVVGEHDVLFLGDGERLLLAHRATDRAVFAKGAIAAAAWLVRQPPGRYTMRDVVHLSAD